VLATNARNSSTSRMRDHVSSILSDHAEGYEGGVTDRLPPTCAVLAAAIAKSGQAEKETNCLVARHGMGVQSAPRTVYPPKVAA